MKLVSDRDIMDHEQPKLDHRYEFSELGIAATELEDAIVKSPAMHAVV